ncbi:MAG TPA: hypothetical protein V6D08_05395 [Candidatus Obscuribacterales bacterium]
MRTFSITYSVPGSCDCCGAALPVPPGGASPGTYTLELPEGETPTEVRIADALRVRLGGRRLEVSLRQRRGSNRQWSLKPLYNSDAFARPCVATSHPQDDPDYYWYVFSFELPEFEPAFATWWAQLDFVESPWGARPEGGHISRSHNAATVAVRLTRLE